jgi:hypothetical protein
MISRGEISMSTKGRSGAEVMEAISQADSIHLVLRDVSFSANSEDGRGWADLRLSRELAIELGLLW